MSALITDASGNHTLAIARSLGRRGIHVSVASHEPTGKAFYSRYVGRRFLYPSPAGPLAATRARLLQIIDLVRPDVFIPVTERVIMMLAPARAQIEDRVGALPLPSERALNVVFDKLATTRLADSLEVATPRTHALESLAELPALRDGLGYPVVIKPRQSEHETADGQIVSAGPPEYCAAPERFAATYMTVHRRSPLPLVQEFIPGEGYGVSVLYRQGELRALFAHHRLRMVRPTGSGSALRESIAPPPLMVAAARRLLEALAWHGVAMVEFKVDTRTGLPVLMEINGRFWNSLPLAVAAGVDFPYLLYRLALDGDVAPCLDYRAGVRARWLAGDLRHLIAVFQGPPPGWTAPFPGRWQTVGDFVKIGGRVHRDVLSFRDPVPSMVEAYNFFREMGAASNRVLRRSLGMPVVRPPVA